MGGYSEIANFLKVVGVIIVGKLIPIRMWRIAMSSQEYNQSINVITQYYILHKIIFTNVNYITISWLNTLRRRPCSRNLGCRGGKKTVLYLQGESKDEKAEQRGISVYSSPDSVFVSVAGSRFLLLSSHLAWKKILDLLIFWFFIITDWKTSWIASLLG